MSRSGTDPALELIDLAPPERDLRAEVLAGLRAPQKSLPCKFFYDERGSRLFERITRLAEYYPTRVETAILRAHVHEMAERLGPRCVLVEYGSGSSEKTRILLDALRDPVAYVPIDISGDYLLAAARNLAREHPRLRVVPLRADYTAELKLPALGRGRRRVVYFPGSTVGNFEPDDARAFLRSVAEVVGERGMLLIGVDLKKDPRVLHAAYNDAEGVTAEFNENALRNINRQIGADFDPATFHHYAFYNVLAGRIEMHLVSDRAQDVTVAGECVRFAAGETIHTENSYKYAVDEFRALARAAGFTPRRCWTDADELFSVHLCEAGVTSSG